MLLRYYKLLNELTVKADPQTRWWNVGYLRLPAAWRVAHFQPSKFPTLSGEALRVDKSHALFMVRPEGFICSTRTGVKANFCLQSTPAYAGTTKSASRFLWAHSAKSNTRRA